MLPIVVLYDGSDVLDALDRERLEERDERDELLGCLVARALPGGEEDTVRRLKLEVRWIRVEDDGALKRATEVGEILRASTSVRLEPKRHGGDAP